jgi:Tfp pilus assembly protein PilF
MKGVAVIAAVCGALLIAGCQTEPMRAMRADLENAGSDIKGFFSGNKGDAAFAAGLRQYEDGNYGEAAKQLQSAIDQGLSRSNRVTAHKHLAFIHCVSGRTTACREEFRKALAIDPDLQLSPAEAGHPTWGPVFRSAKAGR